MKPGKAVLCFFLFFVLFASASHGQIVQIGDGNLLNVYLPIEPVANYSYSQSIYTANEINLSGIISDIGFQYRITSNIFLPYTNDFSVYLGIVDRERFYGNTDWVPLDSLTLVFQGELQEEWFYPEIPGQGWLTIPLDTPFFYNGEGNLVVAVDENRAGNSSTGDDFYCTASLLPQSLEIHSMTVNPDPALPPAASAGNPVSIRPNLQLNFASDDYQPHQPLPVDNATDVSQTPTLFWQSNAWFFDVWFAPAGQPLQQVADSIDTDHWDVPNTLNLYSQYQWQVIGYWMFMPYPGPVWTFTTEGETLTAPQNLTAMTMGMDVQLQWQPPQHGSVVSYRIYRNQQLIEECMETEYLDTTALPNLTYWYYVEAVNYLNQVSPPSNSVSVTMPGSIPAWQMNFENQQDFAISMPGWTMYDLDNSPTWQFSTIDFPNEGNPMSWIVFNPSQTTPPLTAVLPHGGQKMMLCLDSTTPPNNDWLISPPILIQNGYVLSFWVRSFTADYGLERLRFLISTSDTLITSFEPLSTEPWLSVPADWTQLVYDLSQYAGQQLRLAWHCISWDAFALCLDDIAIHQTLSDEDETAIPFVIYKIYPNPASEYFIIENKTSKETFNLNIYNIKGQRVVSRKGIKKYEWHKDNDIELKPGLYILNIQTDKNKKSYKLAIK